MKRQAGVLALALAFIFTSCGSAGAGRAQEAAAIPTAAPSPTSTPEPQIVEFTFSASGDNLIHDGIYQQANRRAGGEGYDFSYCYSNVKEFYADHDVNWINQETLINSELPPSTYPCFSTPAQMGQTLYDLGFRAFNLSNNHTYDQGKLGLEATCRFWNSMPQDVVTIGLHRNAEDDGIALQRIKGVTIAYLGFTEHTNGLPTPQGSDICVTYTHEAEKMEAEIRKASQLADLVIVSDHWGVEGSHTVTAAQKALAQQQADWGADLIIGTGPHVVQTAEWLTAADGHPAFVTYSLGNFISAQAAANTMIGAVLDFTVRQTIQNDGSKMTEICSPLLHPIINHYDAKYANVRLYWLNDYTDELAANHGARDRMPGFNLDYIHRTLQDTIPAEFLAM